MATEKPVIAKQVKTKNPQKGKATEPPRFSHEILYHIEVLTIMTNGVKRERMAFNANSIQEIMGKLLPELGAQKERFFAKPTQPTVTVTTSKGPMKKKK